MGTALKLSPPEVGLGIDLGRKGNHRDRKRVSHLVGPTRTKFDSLGVNGTEGQ